jgi:hypothetical protein
MLNQQWILVANNTKVLFASKISRIAQLSNQDVSSDEQTHLGAAHTQILCLIIHTLSM